MGLLMIAQNSEHEDTYTQSIHNYAKIFYLTFYGFLFFTFFMEQTTA